MELRHLRYFIRVAELRSFTKAAAVLDVSQPALSRIIRDLELALGVSLLLRTGRGAVLTDAGVKLLSRAKILVDDAERTFHEVRSLKGRPMGLVSVGMPPSIGTVLAVALVERMRAAFPEIDLQLTEGYSGHIHEWLLSGRLDIGVLYIAQRDVGTKSDLLAREQLYLLGAPSLAGWRLGAGRAVDFSVLPQLPLILPARPHTIRKLVDEVAAKLHLEIHPCLEINAFLTIRDLVIHGHGFTILPISSVRSDVAAGRLKAAPIENPPLMQNVGVMASPHHPTSLAATTVIRLIQQVARELVTSGAWPERDEPDRGPGRKRAPSPGSAPLASTVIDRT